MATKMAICKTTKKMVAMGAAVMALLGAFGGEPLIYPASDILAYAKTLEPRISVHARRLHGRRSIQAIGIIWVLRFTLRNRFLSLLGASRRIYDIIRA